MQRGEEWMHYELLESDLQQRIKKVVRTWRKRYAKTRNNRMGFYIIGPLNIGSTVLKRNVRTNSNRGN